MVEKNMKKVLFICKGHPNIAGAQQYLQHIEGCFPKELFELHYAYCFSDGDRVFREIEQKRPVKRWQYDWRHLSFWKSFRYARTLLGKVRPDFIIFSSTEDEVIPPLLAAKISAVSNRIMVVHWALDSKSLPLLVKKSNLFFPIPSRYSLKIRTKRLLAYSFLDKIIFVNNGTRRAYTKLYKVSPDKCKTIYNGVDVDAFSVSGADRDGIRSSLGVNEGETMILATGNLSPVKGHAVLVKAVAKLRDQGTLVKCFVAGQGDLFESLKRLVEQKKIGDQFKLMGYRDDIPQLLAATDIFCMPSLNEALGYSLIEAMAAGKPVIATRVGGIPEVVTDLADGLLVEADNPDQLCVAISRLMTDDELREKIADAAIQKVRSKFSTDEMIKSTAQFFGV